MGLIRIHSWRRLQMASRSWLTPWSGWQGQAQPQTSENSEQGWTAPAKPMGMTPWSRHGRRPRQGSTGIRASHGLRGNTFLRQLCMVSAVCFQLWPEILGHGSMQTYPSCELSIGGSWAHSPDEVIVDGVKVLPCIPLSLAGWSNRAEKSELPKSG